MCNEPIGRFIYSSLEKVIAILSIGDHNELDLKELQDVHLPSVYEAQYDIHDKMAL